MFVCETASMQITPPEPSWPVARRVDRVEAEAIHMLTGNRTEAIQTDIASFGVFTTRSNHDVR